MSDPRPPYMVAEIWHCGDEVCDCYQPQITLIKPHNPPMPPWIVREQRWAGAFFSQPGEEEWVQMKTELREACLRFGIALHEETMTGMKETAE